MDEELKEEIEAISKNWRDTNQSTVYLAQAILSLTDKLNDLRAEISNITGNCRKNHPTPESIKFIDNTTVSGNEIW